MAKSICVRFGREEKGKRDRVPLTFETERFKRVTLPKLLHETPYHAEHGEVSLEGRVHVLNAESFRVRRVAFHSRREVASSEAAAAAAKAEKNENATTINKMKDSRDEYLAMLEVMVCFLFDRNTSDLKIIIYRHRGQNDRCISMQMWLSMRHKFHQVFVFMTVDLTLCYNMR